MKLHETIAHLEHLVGKNLSVRRIEQALTNATFEINNGDCKYSLRMNNPESQKLGIDRDREATILQHINHENWSPTVLDFQSNWMLSLWHTGHVFHPKDDSELKQLSNLFLTVQNVPTQPLSCTKPINIADQIALLRKFIPQLIPAFKDLATSVCNQYQLPTNLRLCFHDWHPGNLLKNDSQITLIDWEYAALGDPNIDLACLMSGFNLNTEQAKALFTSYDLSDNTLDKSLCLTTLLALCWYMVRFPNKDWRAEQLSWLQRWDSKDR